MIPVKIYVKYTGWRFWLRRIFRKPTLKLVSTRYFDTLDAQAIMAGLRNSESIEVIDQSNEAVSDD